MHHDGLPFYPAQDLSVEAVLTDHDREVCGTPLHPYELYPDVNELTHYRTQVREPQINNCVERFHRTVKEESFEVAFRQTICEFNEALQADPDMWSVHGNAGPPCQGYRNMGRRPSETVEFTGNLFAKKPSCTPCTPTGLCS